jgi:hypothetical protein
MYEVIWVVVLGTSSSRTNTNIETTTHGCMRVNMPNGFGQRRVNSDVLPLLDLYATLNKQKEDLIVGCMLRLATASL